MLRRRMGLSGDSAALTVQVCAAGIEAFGELDVDAEVIARTIDDALANGVAAHQLQQFAAEIYLGAACGAGRPAAAAALDRRYIARVDEMIAAKRLPPHGVDEVRQTVRERLLAGEPPYVAGAVGRGALTSLVAVIATRAAIDWLRVDARGAARHTTEPDAEILAATGDPARDHLRAHYRAEIKAAFEAALAELEPRERTLLRLHLVDGMTIDDIAALYRIHRATAARRIDRARDRVASTTRKALSRATALGGRDLRELAALVTSQLDLSLSRVLASDAEPR
jgi:RNA polymerase sigma-70 factor (ECF subfamily)